MPTTYGRTHFVIPDCHVGPGKPTDHLRWIGNWIVDKKPDVVVCLGDFADMPSLSSYDKGKKSFEGRRYKADIDSAVTGMKLLVGPLHAAQKEASKRHKKAYKPEMHFCIGNHEDRITRAVELAPELEGTISIDDLKYSQFGWKVHPFLAAINLDGIFYSHYFPRNPQGRVLQSKHGSPSAAAQVKREMCSCTAGHLQGIDYFIYQGPKRFQGLICGSCYLHDEDYLGPQGNNYWRGCVTCYQCHDGTYDKLDLSLEYLCYRNEGITLDKFMKLKDKKS